MADFLTELFESIFTPGPSPPLVRATNAAFAALQLILLLMLVLTRSPHFAVLTVLCAGLWWSINWFVRELAAARAAAGDDGGGGAPADPSGRGTARASGGERPARRRKGTRGDAEESGTETEELERIEEREATVEPEPRPPRGPPPPGLQAEDTLLGKRQSFGGDVSGTDSEWDKISETEGMADSRMSND